MSKPTDNPADPFKKALAEATRTMADDPEMTVTYSVDPSGVSGDSMRLPQVSRRMTREEVLLARGTGDALALRMRHHNAAISARYTPTGEIARELYDAMETARCEALGARDMPGTLGNINAKIEHEAARKGYAQVTDRMDVPLSVAAGYMIRERATGRSLPPNAGHALDLWREYFETRTAEDLDIVDHALVGLARAQVEAPFVQHEVALSQVDGFFQSARIGLTLLVLVQAVGGADHDHFLAFFPGVDDMQHVGGFGGEPANFMGLAVARQNAKAGRLVGMKAHFVAPGSERICVGPQRKIMQDGVVLGDRHVVGQARPGQRDGRVMHQLPFAIDHPVMHERRIFRVVEEHQLARLLVHLGVGRDAVQWHPRRLAAAPQRHRIEHPCLAALVKRRIGLTRVDDDIELRKKALIKLQAFHTALGEDSQIYSPEEEVRLV